MRTRCIYDVHTWSFFVPVTAVVRISVRFIVICLISLSRIALPAINSNSRAHAQAVRSGTTTVTTGVRVLLEASVARMPLGVCLSFSWRLINRVIVVCFRFFVVQQAMLGNLLIMLVRSSAARAIRSSTTTNSNNRRTSAARVGCCCSSAAECCCCCCCWVFVCS